MIEQNIIKLYESGLTIRDIAAKSDSSYETVRKILKKNNVKWHRSYVTDFTKEQIEDIVKLYDEDLTIKEIGKKYNISGPAISRILKKQGVNVVCSMRKYDHLREIPITDIQKQFVVGTVLGDGCLHRDNDNSNYKLSFGHCVEQKEYFEWKRQLLNPFTNTYFKSFDKRFDSIMLRTATISHLDLNYFGDSFYTKDRIKIIPENLKQYLTPLALAVWIMDDGSLNAGVNMRIASMSFTEKENIRLQKYLYDCFELICKVTSGKYPHLEMNKENTQVLSNIIRPHIVDCMKYKIMP